MFTYIFGGIVFIVACLFTWCLCKSAGDADKEMERMIQEEVKLYKDEVI